MDDSRSRKPQRGLLLIANLPTLQNLVKRDPDGYASEFATQWDYYDSLRRIIELGTGVGEGLGPGSVSGSQGSSGSRGRKETEDKFREVVGFISRTAPCYATKAKPVRPVKTLPGQLMSLLLDRHEQLRPDTTKDLVSALTRLRGQSGSLLSDLDLLKILFPLLSMTTSSTLRATILKTILTDIRKANLKHKNHKLNRTVQGLLFTMVERGLETPGSLDGTGVKGATRAGKAPEALAGAAREGLWAVKLTSELWRRRVWDDPKTVQILATACCHTHTKVQSLAVNFFLADTDPTGPEGGLRGERDGDEEEEEIDVAKLHRAQTVTKKRKSSDRKVKEQTRLASKKRKAKELAATVGHPNFSALHQLQDPQSLGERLYESLLRNDKRYTFDHKLLLVRLFSRISGTHKLQVLGFYSYMLRFLTPHQVQVTSVLAALAESSHDLTPPDALTPCLRKISNEFIHPGVANEAIAAGLNAVREVCKRQPWAMEADLLEDLVEYRKSKDKGVMVASRGLLALYREVNPGLLKRRERGKVASMKKGDELEPARYGEPQDTVRGIAGLGLLAKALAEKAPPANGDGGRPDEAADEEGWKDWEVDSDSSSDDSGGWIAVSSEDEGGGDIDITDSSDDEGEGGRRAKRQESKRRKLAAANVWKAGEADGSPDEESGEEEEGGDDDDDDDEEEEEEEEEEAVSVATPGADVQAIEEETDLVNSIAATRILTPADYARLNELRTKALEDEAAHGGGTASKRKLAALKAAKRAIERGGGEEDPNSRFLTEGDIIGVQKKAKADYEERMASIQAGREGRDKFGSRKVRGRKGQKNGAPGSSTNEAKARGKAFAMTQHSMRVRTKKGASLRDKQKTLRAHIDRKKRGGRRGNG